MIATIFHAGKEYKIDFFKPLDISMPLYADKDCASAWYVEPMKLEPVVMGTWVGDVNKGGSVNFRTVTFNPHGNGTHTECAGHISKEFYTINKNLQRFMFVAELISVLPFELENGDFVITRKQLENALRESDKPEALIIRTLGNNATKLHTNYSNTNPPYILKEAIEYLNELGVMHLLLDMPSVDKEVDGGKLEAHHAFWNYPENTQLHKTITELIYVPNDIFDGTYILNLQIAPFENDASPSKPVLYKVF
ncbi:MAG: cyclase family protein [Bacteroidetes bacterium]|nr:cyclase family protein [Bacteroidota bacterium]